MATGAYAITRTLLGCLSGRAQTARCPGEIATRRRDEDLEAHGTQRDEVEHTSLCLCEAPRPDREVRRLVHFSGLPRDVVESVMRSSCNNAQMLSEVRMQNQAKLYNT